MDLKPKLNRKRKVIIGIWIIVFLVLAFNHFTSKTAELRDRCEAFVRSDEIGCYVSDEEIRSTQLGQELTQLAKSEGFDSAKEACGCTSIFEIIPWF